MPVAEKKRKAVYDKEAITRYLAKLKTIAFRVKPEEYDRFEKAAKEQGYPSMRQFFLAAINEKIERGE